MRTLGFTGAVVAATLSCCSSAPHAPKYEFYEQDGSYDQCQFDGYLNGDINGELESDKSPQPYFHVIGHGYEKKVDGVWLPFVHQWRSKNGRIITFVVRDGTGSGDSSGYWYGTMNGQRAGGYTIVPRFRWAFKNWNGTAEFECHNPGEDEF